jgi:hypothetical protein
MLQLLSVKKLSLVLVCILFSCGIGGKDAVAAAEAVSPLQADISRTDESTMRQSPGNSRNMDPSGMAQRIADLEQQVRYLTIQLSRNLTVGNTAREAKELASDAWTLAVEARAIAVRAEQKAEKATGK